MTEPRYINKHGETTADDPERIVWYGTCGHWSDDWNKISKYEDSGIPCCPNCGSVGYSTTFGIWNTGVMMFQAKGNPGYANFVDTLKEDCFGKPVDLGEEYRKWLRLHPNGRITNPRSAGD